MKEIVTIRELVEMGYPEKVVRQSCRSSEARRFARKNAPKGKYYINYEKWKEYWNDTMRESPKVHE